MTAEEELLTNERLKGRFSNNFEMINLAIQMAKAHIRASEPKTVGFIIDELIEHYPKKPEFEKK